MKQIIAFVSALLVLIVLTGCGGKEAVQTEEVTISTMVPKTTMPTEATETVAQETSQQETAGEIVDAPDELVVGKSTLEDVSLYYQAEDPLKDVYAVYRDFDGNGYGDLAVCRNASYLGIYFMDENDVVSNIVLFDEAEFTFLCGYWGPEKDPAEVVPNIFETYEVENNGTVGIYTFYGIADDGSLYIRDRIKYDANGVEWKWFATVDSDWVSITEETYREIMGYYWADAEDPKPIEDYYHR